MKAIVKFLFVFVIFFFSWGVCVDKLLYILKNLALMCPTVPGLE